jgi:hypothetical protein
MKQFLFLLCLTPAVLYAQNKSAQKLFKQGKIEKAKTEIDAQTNLNSKDWYLKSEIYKEVFSRTNDYNAGQVSLNAVKNYVDACDREGDKDYLTLTINNREALTDLYSIFSRNAAEQYNSKDYVKALEGFKGSVAVFDFLAKKDWTNGLTLDTLSVLYAGISAEKASMFDVAAEYYGKIADAKSKAQGYESIYAWLIDYYNKKGDEKNSSKYAALGMSVYPEVDWSKKLKVATPEKDDETQSANDVTQFIGIKFGTPRVEVKKALIAKGGVLKRDAKDDMILYDVAFGNYTAKYVVVLFTKAGVLAAGEVMLESDKEPQILEFYLRFADELTAKYGEPVTERTFKQPYKYGDGFEHSSLKSGYGIVKDTWKKASGIVRSEIVTNKLTDNLGVSIAYTSNKYVQEDDSTKDF